MLKIFLTFIVTLISVYWVGEKARRNPKIDEFLRAVEGHYSKLNGRLEDATTRRGLEFLRRFYGWVSVFLFSCLYLVQRLAHSNADTIFPLFWIFSFFFMGWFSIKWVIDHKNTVAEFSRNNALIIFGPLILGIFDSIFNTPFAKILSDPFFQLAAGLHFTVPEISSPLAMGGAISLLFCIFFGIYYFVTWIITIPVFLVSVLTVVFPIRLARALAKIDRNNTFFWFTVFIMFVISTWLTQL